jgi:hypothetical protein
MINKYKVLYSIEVDAEDHESAAKMVDEWIKESQESVYVVTNLETNKKVTIDMADFYDGE